MAAIVSTPLQLQSALRGVEYKFSMASIGVPPEEKKLIYRLLNVTDGQYLTRWKEYPTAFNGQVIPIDFTNDLRKILTSPKPLLGAGVYVDNNIIKTIVVEYGERTINTDTCEDPVDVVDGTTPEIDVVNGIRRHQPIASQADINFGKGIVLHDRAKRYSVSRDSYDALYVIGSKNILISYYSAQNVFISSTQHNIVQPYPNSVCTVVPIGFSIAPAGTALIHISASDLGIPNLTTDLLFSFDNNFYANENGSTNYFDKESRAIVDIYFQNNFGAFDLMCFESMEQISMNVAKQEIINRFDVGSEFTDYSSDQRSNINNTSFPIITFKRSWNKPINAHAAKWLNELAASGNVWVKEALDFGFSDLTPVLLKFQLTNSEVITKSGEFIISGYYSEVYLYPN